MRVLTLIVMMTVVSACETTKGVGRDVQRAGEALEQAF